MYIDLAGGIVDSAKVNEIIQEKAVSLYPQTLTEEQQAQARGNIGVSAGGVTGAVLYDQPLSLTDAQKEQARENIDAVGTSDLESDYRTAEDQDAIDAEKADKSELADYAKKDGYYETLGAGYAKSLLGNGAATLETIDFRPSGGTKDIGTGAETLKGVRGNSVVFNQLENNNHRWLNNSGGKPIVGSYDAETSIIRITATGTFSGGSSYMGYINVNGLVKNRICFVSFTCSASANVQIAWRLGGTSAIQIIEDLSTQEKKVQGIFNPGSSPQIYCFPLAMNEGDYIEISSTSVNIHDLTIAFGSGNEPSSLDDPRIKWLQRLGNVPYTEPTIINYKGTGLRTLGVNLFDGTKAKVIAGMAYYILGTYTTLKFAETLDGDQTDITPSANLYTPERDGYIFATGTSDEFQIALYHSGGDIPTTYHPYEEHILPLPVTTAKGKLNGQGESVTVFPDGMKSAGSACDYGYGNTLGVVTHFRKVIGERAYQEGDEDDATLVTDGTTTLYPLATPEDYTLDQPIATTGYVNDWGVEENQPQGKDESGLPLTTPLVAEIVYAPNLVDANRNMPKNYIGIESMDAILEAFKGIGVISDFTLTFNETTGKYECTLE